MRECKGATACPTVRLAAESENSFVERAARAATMALLQEVSATPKPGLVDRHNTGAHTDMNFCTFCVSALALYPYFGKFIRYGIEHCGGDPSAFLSDIRPIGLDAENAMFRATGGVNTHKGAVFSVGILCTAYGYLYGNRTPFLLEQLSRVCSRIAAPALADFIQADSVSASTFGFRLYVKTGITGIRGEAARGFPLVFFTSVPVMRRLLSQGYSLNDSGIISLVHIMAELIDTNIIHRSSPDEALKIRERMRTLVQNHIGLTDYICILEKLDREFISRNISPGGSADLLAMSYFVCFMEQRNE